MNQTYASLIRETGEGLGASYPGFLEISNEISALGWALTEELTANTMPSDSDRCRVSMPTSAVCTPDPPTEELMFLPFDAPVHLLPSPSTLTANCQGELFLQQI